MEIVAIEIAAAQGKFAVGPQHSFHLTGQSGKDARREFCKTETALEGAFHIGIGQQVGGLGCDTEADAGSTGYKLLDIDRRT